MRSATFVAVAAAVAAPAFVSALPTPQAGSDAVSLNTVDTGVKIIGDAANAVSAVKNAWDSVKSREVEELLAREEFGEASQSHEHEGKHHKHHRHPNSKGRKAHKAHKGHKEHKGGADDERTTQHTTRELEELLARAFNGDYAQGHGAHGSSGHHGHMFLPRDDGSDAISAGTALNLGKDAYNAFEAGKSVYDSFKNNHRREFEEILAREISDQYQAHAMQHAGDHGFWHPMLAAAHAARDDGSDAFSIGTALKAGEHTFNALENLKNNNRRELEEILAREIVDQYRPHGFPRPIIATAHAARDDGSDAFSISTALKAGEHTFNALESLENNNRRSSIVSELEGILDKVKAKRNARTVVNGIDTGLKVAGDAGNAVSAVHNAWDSFKNKQSRSVVNDVDTGLKIAGDAGNAVSAVHNAWDSFKNSRSILDELD